MVWGGRLGLMRNLEGPDDRLARRPRGDAMGPWATVRLVLVWTWMLGWTLWLFWHNGAT